MSDKPCRWLLVMDAHPAWGGRKFNACIHPLIVHMGEDKWYNGRPAKCEGCPCHEPERGEATRKQQSPIDRESIEFCIAIDRATANGVRIGWGMGVENDEQGLQNYMNRHQKLLHEALADMKGEEGVKEPLTTGPDHIRDATKMVCRWWQDYHGNWCCSCRATLPQFTPWRGTSPTGHNCPYCRGIIGMDPPYSESIHSCGPHCERPACVQRRTESGEFRQVHDKP